MARQKPGIRREVSKLANFILTPFSGGITQVGYCRVVIECADFSLLARAASHLI
jgi:hypothetical protein